jgi:hypothetical protein
MSDLLDEYEQKTGHSVPIHGGSLSFWPLSYQSRHKTVDAASGGFVAPFATVCSSAHFDLVVALILMDGSFQKAQTPVGLYTSTRRLYQHFVRFKPLRTVDLFKLFFLQGPQVWLGVCRYGLLKFHPLVTKCLPGVGWIVWRDKAHLPKDLIFELHYLGSVEYSFSLNFSRPAAPIIAQYFSLIHLGFEGYRNIALDDLRNARLLSRALERSGYYTVLSDIHRKIGGTNSSIKDAVGLEDDVEVRKISTLPFFPDIFP